MERVLTNIVMYLDVLRPRNFDSLDLQTELPMDTTFAFCYDEFEVNATEANKLMIKDIRTTTVSMKSSKRNLEFMFKILEQILSLHTEIARVRNTNMVTGKTKRGMPGFNEMGMTVEVTISVIMNRLIEVICMKDAQPAPGQLVSS